MAYYTRRSTIRQHALRKDRGGPALSAMLLVGLAWVFTMWLGARSIGVDLSPVANLIQSLGLDGQPPPLVHSGYLPAPGQVDVAGVQAAPSAAVAPEASTQGSLAPHCVQGKTPRFQLGFAELKRHLGDVMGTAIECEHVNAANGDGVQKTSTGLAVYSKHTNTLTFTDGWRHWALLPGGRMVEWVGTSADPPR